MQFEKKISELESIVSKLDQSDTSLEKGIELFGQGVVITKDCLAILNESKGKITIIKKELDKLIEEPFEEI